MILLSALGALVSLAGLAMAVRSLILVRAAERAIRRGSFAELLDQAEAERIKRQVEAEGDQLPW